MCHSLVHPQLTQLLVVARCFLGDLDIFMDCARTLQDATFKTIRVMNDFRETLFTRREVFTSSVVNCIRRI